VALVGVSPDSVESHRRWKEKLRIPHPLLADTRHEAAEAYGVWVEKSIMGRLGMGVARTTFIIDEQGTVAKVFRNVKVQGHSAEVLAALRAMPRG
jgi:peroxiredoxin Q/BCP